MEEQTFIGYIEENALENTLVLNAEGQPLVIAALDMDVEPNNQKLKYNIINTVMDSYFKLDENTGVLFTSKVCSFGCNVNYFILCHILVCTCTCTVHVFSCDLLYYAIFKRSTQLHRIMSLYENKNTSAQSITLTRTHSKIG